MTHMPYDYISDAEREQRGLGPNTKPSDPAYRLLEDDYTSKPKVYRAGCYICEDPEFSQMGLPLCNPCPECSAKAKHPAGHIAADDTTCDDCGYDAEEAYYEMQDHEAMRANGYEYCVGMGV